MCKRIQISGRPVSIRSQEIILLGARGSLYFRAPFLESKKMNRLKGMSCYLCGPMDRVSDGGVKWRQDITPQLKDLGVGVLDPCDKPSNYATEDSDTRQIIDYCKENGNFDSISTIMKPICAVDLRMVDIAHFLVVNLDLDVHMCGSYHEMFVALGQKKPVLIRCVGGKEKLPNWMFGVLPHEMVFANWFQLMDYLHHVNNDEVVEHYNRWRFFDFDKVYGTGSLT